MIDVLNTKEGRSGNTLQEKGVDTDVFFGTHKYSLIALCVPPLGRL